MLGDVDADRLGERGIGGQRQLSRCPGHGRCKLHGGRGDAIRVSVRDAHDNPLGTQVDVGQNVELLGGGDDGAMSSAELEREVAVKTAWGPVLVTRQSETPGARWNSAAEIKSDPLVISLMENS